MLKVVSVPFLSNIEISSLQVANPSTKICMQLDYQGEVTPSPSSC